jgi:hypothetical protein
MCQIFIGSYKNDALQPIHIAESLIFLMFNETYFPI